METTTTPSTVPAATGIPEHYCPTCGSAILSGYCSNPTCSSYVDAD